MVEAWIAGLFMAVAIVSIFVGLERRHATARSTVDPLEARLAAFSNTEGQITLAEVEMSMSFSDRVIRPFFHKIAAALAKRTKENQAQLIQERLNLAGRPYGLTVGGLLAVQMVGAVLGVIIGLAVGGLMNASLIIRLGLILIVGGVFYYLPNSSISSNIKKRQKEILLALPSALDLLTISVEAGLGFDAALDRVSSKYTNALTDEFKIALNEMRLGRPRLEALDDLGRRCHVEELNSFMQAIIQSEQLGVSIANILRIQSEEIRRKRRQRAQEAGAQAPIKMLLPMVMCIFPTLFIILLGPAAVKIFAGSS